MKDISILFLDDDKHRHKYVSKFIKRMKIYSDRINFNCSCYYDASQAIKILNKKTFDIIMLDHDLSMLLNKNDRYIEEITGYEVCKNIVKNPNKHKESLFIVHSLNPVGAENMVKILKQFSLDAVYVPYAWLGLDFDEKTSKVIIRKPGLLDLSEYNNT